MKTEQLARKRYKDRSGNSGVRSFVPGPTSILVCFKDGECYEYDETKPGKRPVEEMKRLAEEGRGLATYINQHVRGNYARKL